MTNWDNTGKLVTTNKLLCSDFAGFVLWQPLFHFHVLLLPPNQQHPNPVMKKVRQKWQIFSSEIQNVSDQSATFRSYPFCFHFVIILQYYLQYLLDQTPQLLFISSRNFERLLFESNYYLRAAFIKLRMEDEEIHCLKEGGVNPKKHCHACHCNGYRARGI